MRVLKSREETCVALGLSSSQRMFDVEEAESRLVSHVLTASSSLCVPRRRLSDCEIWSGMLREMNGASCCLAVV